MNNFTLTVSNMSLEFFFFFFDKLLDEKSLDIIVWSGVCLPLESRPYNFGVMVLVFVRDAEFH